MKAIAKIAIIFLVIGFFYSCDPGEDTRLANQKLIDDSIALATQDARDLNKSLQTQLAEMTSRLAVLHADLDTAKHQISEINDCHFWLTKAECEKLAHDQAAKIQSMEKEQAELEKKTVETSIKLKQVEQQLAAK